MIIRFHRRSLPSLPQIVGAVLGVACLASAADPDCAATARQVSRLVAAKPERVLLIVEDTLVVGDACACEVVKAAIKASSASAKLAGQIVLVAVSAAPTKSTVIAECAKAASPDAAGEIDAAVRKALGPDSNSQKSGGTAAAVPAAPSAEGAVDKQPASNSAKNPPPTDPPEAADFGLSPVAIGGVYLVYPGSGSSPQLVKGKDGSLNFVGPGGRLVPLEAAPVDHSHRPSRPPSIIIIHPPTATASESFPSQEPPAAPAPAGQGLPLTP